MAKSPLLDFKKFDHVSSTKEHTILKHKDGHTLKIAHKALGPDFQKQLEAMSSLPKQGHITSPHKSPKLMADGGKVADKEINPKLEQSKKTSPDEHQKMAAGGVASKDTDTSSKESKMSDDELLNELDVKDESKSASEELINREKSSKPTPKPEAKGGRIKMAEGEEVPKPSEDTSTQDQDNESYSKAAGRILTKDVSVPVIKGLMALGHGIHHMFDESAKSAADAIQGGTEEYNKAFPDTEPKTAPEGAITPPPPSDMLDTNADKEVQENKDYRRELASGQSPDVPPASAPSDGGGVPSISQSALKPGVIPQYQNSTDAALQTAEKATPQQTYANLTQEEKNAFNQQKMAWENDLVNGHITPKTYSDLFASKSTLSKIGSIFGMLIGGAGSGLSKQPNIAFNMIQNELDRDFEAQKQSKGNAQNYLRIMQQDAQNKAQNARMTTENAVQALGLARVHANDAVLHSLIMERDKFPVGSAQWKAADQGLAMMYPMFQQSASKAGDMVAGAKAYYRMIQGNATADDPASQIRKKQMVGIITPEQSKEALKELGQNENHIRINKNVLDTFDQVQKMSNAGSFMGSPFQNQERIDALWSPMMDKLTKDTEGRVTPVTVDMMNHLKPKWFPVKDNATTTKLKRDQLIKTLSGSLATPTLDAIGIKVDKGEMPGETREVGGKLYRKNPATGGWKPVSE